MTAADRYPKTVVLTDGAHLVLRLAVDADADARRALRARVGAGAGEAGALVVVACDGDRLAGELRLTRDADEAVTTVAVEVALDPAYHGRRLGTWMLLDAIHAAEHLGAARLVARVAHGDTAFEAALARLDFVDEPSRGNGAGGADEASPAVRRMVKPLHASWTDF
jgi:RimJ/RimL family protein N-acetyltransferase